jgi:hypothetical protein
LTWEYVAGFVDGEGNIEILKGKGSFDKGIRLTIPQKTPRDKLPEDNVLFRIRQFLHEQLGPELGCGTICTKSRSGVLVLTLSTRPALAALKRVEPHLFVKGDRAREALEYKAPQKVAALEVQAYFSSEAFLDGCEF